MELLLIISRSDLQGSVSICVLCATDFTKISESAYPCLSRPGGVTLKGVTDSQVCFHFCHRAVDHCPKLNTFYSESVILFRFIVLAFQLHELHLSFSYLVSITE